MTSQMITPPVPAVELAEQAALEVARSANMENVVKNVEADVKKAEQEVAKVADSPAVSAEITALQKVLRSDKSAIVAGLVHVAVPLVAALGLRLNGQDVAILTSIVSSGVTYFLSLNFRVKAAAKAAVKS